MNNKVMLAIAIGLAGIDKEVLEARREGSANNLNILLPLKVILKILKNPEIDKITVNAVPYETKKMSETSVLDDIAKLPYTQENCRTFLSEALKIAAEREPTYTKFSSKDRREVILKAFESTSTDPFALFKNSDRNTRESLLYQMSLYKRAGHDIVALSSDLERLPRSLVIIIERLILR